MKSTYIPTGTCSTKIEVDIEDGILHDVKFSGGCPGNLQAISRLVKGMEVNDAIERLDDIRCGNKLTSCADQLEKALKIIRAKRKEV